MNNTYIQNSVRGFISAIVILAAILVSNSIVYAQSQDYTLSKRSGGTDWKKSDLLSKKELRSNLYNDMFTIRLKDSVDNLKPMDTGNAENVKLVGRWANGPCMAVAVTIIIVPENIAYFGNGGYLEIVDFSDPAKPVELGKVFVPAPVQGVAISGGWAYVADGGDGLRVIDVFDKTHPFEAGYFDTGGSAWGVAVSGGNAYVADGEDGLRVIDVSDPTHPFEAGYFDTRGSARGIAASGGYAYVADGGDGLRVIDVSDPTYPFEAGFFDTGNFASGVAVSGAYAYVADWEDGLRVIDISDPTHPFEVGYFDTGGHAWAVAVSGGYACVADREDGLRVIDVSDPPHPFEIGYFNMDGYAQSVAMRTGYAYVAGNEDGLRVIDVSDPTHPFEAGYFDTRDLARGVAVRAGYAYVADGEDGLRVIDVSDPTYPFETGYFDTGGHAWSVAVIGSYAYVAEGVAGLRVIDVSDPTNPFEIGYFNTDGYAQSVAVRIDYAYVADWEAGLRVIDVSDPTDPFEAGYFDTDGYADDVFVSGGYAYVADMEAGLRVIDVSDPTDPFEAGYFDTAGDANDVAVNGGYAYVADMEAGLRVIDVSDPTNPFEVGYFDTNGEPHDVIVSGSYAYVADYWDGLRVIDVSDPTHPFEAGYFDTGSLASGVAVSGAYAYVADWRDGLYILRYLGESVVTVTSPNGGENWSVGSSQDITWTAVGAIDNVKIEYSTDNGTGWIEIITSTQNDGEHEWLIPPTPSLDCLVRISDAVDGEPFDVSDSTFVIGSKGNVNGDGEVDIFDLVKLINFILEKVEPNMYEFWAADMNDDGVLDIFDVVKMINIILEGDITTLAKMAASPAQVGELSVPDVEFVPEHPTEVPVYANFDGTVTGIQLELCYDPQALKVSAPVLVSRTDQMELASADKDGKLTILIYSASGNVIEAGSDLIINLRIETLSGFNGTTRLEINNAIVVNGKAEAISVDYSSGNIVAAKPKTYFLSQNYPNPFNAQTVIRYRLPKSGQVVLNIYNTLGQEIRTLVDEEQEAGYYNINWDGRNNDGTRVSSGIYIYRIQTGDFVKTKKMLFVM